MFTDFSTLTAPDITGWVPHGLSGNWQWLTADDAGATGGRVMRQSAGTSGGNYSHLYWNTFGLVDGTTDAVEIVTRFKTRAGETTAVDTIGIVGLMLQPDAEVGYTVRFPTATTARVGRILNGSVNAHVGNETALGFTLAVDQYYWIRFRRETDGVFKVKVWVDGSAEPGAWLITTPVNTVVTSGYVGLIGYLQTAERDYDLVGAALNDTAPVSGGAVPSVTVTNAGDETFVNGETGIVIQGTGFGTTQGAGSVIICPTDDVNDIDYVQQTVTQWDSDTAITITAVRGALPLNQTVYLFVANGPGGVNANGYPVQFVPRAYIRESLVNLSGAAASVNGDALLVWRARPTAANPNPDQVITLGNIPTGVLDVEIQAGSLAVDDPVWVMIVPASGNAATARRVIPDYE